MDFYTGLLLHRHDELVHDVIFALGRVLARPEEDFRLGAKGGGSDEDVSARSVNEHSRRVAFEPIYPARRATRKANPGHAPR